jgi:hypothetical protein
LGHFHIMFIPSCAKLNSSYGVAITWNEFGMCELRDVWNET